MVGLGILDEDAEVAAAIVAELERQLAAEPRPDAT